MRRLFDLPLFLLLTGLSALGMLAPAALALWQQEFHVARSFFYGAILGVICTALVALALGNRPHNRNAMRQLMGLMAGFAVLPLMMAVPFHAALGTTTLLNAYVEMTSALTTTGATLFAPQRLPDALHLWRAMAGWFGGLVIWIAAAAILAPLAIGGFEVTSTGEPGQVLAEGNAQAQHSNPQARLARATQALAPAYAGLTAVLFCLLWAAGDAPLIALCHAMSVMSTSGISPVGGLEQAASARLGEALILVFFVFALSRLTFSRDTAVLEQARLTDDPELRVGLAIALSVPVLLFLRHWLAALDVDDPANWTLALRSLWGAIFTVLSFLSTTGFVSADWGQAQAWSGLPTPGVILVGLAMIGGGVATTAGGVKLLRVFALYLNGVREVERLLHPSLVGRTGVFSRRMRREGAFIAWVFFMLFAMTIAGVTTVLGLLGVSLEPAIVLTVAALANTGPLVQVGLAEPLQLGLQPDMVKIVFCATMLLGRLELLAIFVLLAPESWRD